jgi:transposase
MYPSIKSTWDGGLEPAETARPSYHPAILLKIYIYLNRVLFSCRSELEAQRDVELRWPTGRLIPTSRHLRLSPQSHDSAYRQPHKNPRKAIVLGHRYQLNVG